MTTLILFNQEINIDEYAHLPDELLIADLKINFFKYCILDLIRLFMGQAHLPPDLLGFTIHLEVAVKQENINYQSDEQLSNYLNKLITAVRQREQLHRLWSHHVVAQQKLSFLFDKLRLRLFSSEVQFAQNKEIIDAKQHIDDTLNAAQRQLQKQLLEMREKRQKDLLLVKVKDAFIAYQQLSWRPIATERYEQYLDLLSQIEQANTVSEAAHIIYAQCKLIEHSHSVHSFFANLPFYQHKSRWAFHLQQAFLQGLTELKLDLTVKKSTVVQEVENAIQAYLDLDVFYHNRARKRLAYQLLSQLEKDSKASQPAAQYKMRTTLDVHIKKIDEAFTHTYFFSRLYKNKRSRLALNLEVAKEILIRNEQISTLELNLDIKQPILRVLEDLMCSLHRMKQVDAALHAEIRRDFISVRNALVAATTPHAIEALLEGHIRSYLQQAKGADLLTLFKNLLHGEDHVYFIIALKLESALLDWQAQGILPASSGYQTFLSTLAQERNVIESELQRLELSYGITIPRRSSEMRSQNKRTQHQAQALLHRVQAL